MLSATTFILFIAATKEPAQEAARPKGAPPLLWWRPKAATFVVPMNRLVVVALNTIFALRLNKTRRTVGRTDSRLDGWSGVTKDWSGKSDCVASEPFPFYLGRFLLGPLWISRQLASPKVDLFNIFPYASYTFIYLQIYVHILQVTSLYLHISPFTLKYPI